MGAAILIGGLLLFFNRRLPLMFGAAHELGLGVLLLIIGSLTWACYGLAQKRLLREWNSAQLLWVLYVGGALLLTPLAQPSHLRHVECSAGAAPCCSAALNTLIAYGAYAEAMHLGEVDEGQRHGGDLSSVYVPGQHGCSGLADAAASGRTAQPLDLDRRGHRGRGFGIVCPGRRQPGAALRLIYSVSLNHRPRRVLKAHMVGD